MHGGVHKCSYGCDKIQYVKAGHFIRHIQSRHPDKINEVLKKIALASNTITHQCDKCDFKALRKSSMRLHLENKHGKKRNDNARDLKGRSKEVIKKRSKLQPKFLKVEKKFKCFCGKEFPFQSRLRKHQMQHEENNDARKKFACDAAGCKNSFTARCNLIRHQKQKDHLPITELKRIKFNCICGERFFSYRGYSYHCDKSMCKKEKFK